MEFNINLIEFHVILNNVIFPVDQLKLMTDIEASDFAPAIPGQTVQNKLLIQQGDIGVKNNSVATIIPQNKMIQVTGLKISEVYQTWKDLEKILQKQKIHLQSTGRLFEFKIEGNIKTGKNPLKSFKGAYKSTEITQKFDNLFNEKPSTMIGLRFIPSDGNIDTEDYYDIRLEPFLRNLKEEYFLNFIYRNKDQTKCEKLFVKVESKISELLELVENY